MPPGPPIRASDQDRERTARQLTEHHARGRLDAEEFHDRLDRVYEAKTVAELDELTTDLPAVDIYPLPTASLPRNRPVNTDLPAASVLSSIGSAMHRSSGWPAAWASWLLVTLICALLGLVSGNLWPLAWAAGCGVLMAGGWVIGRARRPDGRPPLPGGGTHEIGGPGE